MSLRAGASLGRYVIESPLGAGGMGDVYLAEDTGLHRRVALKLLSGALAADDTARKRLVREAQAAAALDHPNICTIYEVGEANGHSYIAMQYIDGETLAERLKRGPLDLPSAIALGRQVAEALDEAHRLGIVHRDIKPQNIMLTRSSQAKVLDFGIAKTSALAGTDLNTASALTGPGLVPGTTAYMSPEQARCESVDHRSDIFSFGIVLFETVSRAHPFAHQSSAETASAILTKDPAVSDIAAPAELRRILRKCLRHVNFINRISADGKTRERMTTLPIVDIRGVSPDGRWVVAMSARGDNLSRTIAIPDDGGSPRLLCIESCRTAWSPDGRRFFMWKGFFAGRRPHVAVPVPVGRTFPEFPADDRPAYDAWATLPGADAAEQDHFVPSTDPATFVFTKSDELRNLFRIPLAGR